MNRSYSVIALLVLAVSLVFGATSCRKSAYPREAYRGAGYRYDPTTYRTSRVKAKAYRPYKSVRVKPSNYRR